MAILKVIKYGEKILRTPAKEVHKLSAKIQKLAEDMIDTMYQQDGVGLAAPQVGENYRLFVIDAAVGDEPSNPMVFINPKIIKKSGAINSYEGCLSFPLAYTNVRRYSSVVVRAKDIKGRNFTIEASNGSLLCRAIQHENDHLDGILFIDHARSRFITEEELASKGLNPIDPDRLIEEDELENEIQKQESKLREEIEGA